MSGKTLAAGGTLVSIVMIVLLAIGTTSGVLFGLYFILLFASAGTAAVGLRLEKASTFDRLERERLNDA